MSLTFNSTIITDPLSDYEINEGNATIIKLPRQIDPEKAAEIESIMNDV